MLLLAATALAILGGSAYAQNSNSGSNSNANVNTTSGSQSSSVSNPRVNVIGNSIGNGASSSTSGAKAVSSTRSASRSAAVGNTTNVNVGYTGDPSGSSTGATDPSSGQYIGYGGGYTVRNTPEVIPPSVMGGNPCAVGASGGMSVAGFGIAAGGTWADRACERRQQAALLFNMGEQKVALELMCQDEHVRDAMKLSGKPCTADIPVAQTPAVATAPVAQAASGAAVAVAAVVTEPTLIAARPVAAKPEWCAKAAPSTDASRTYVAEACGK
jgi:hypothetical protein